MSALSERVDVALLGEERARNFMTTLRCVLGDGDELGRAIERCPADQLPAFCRTIQREIERRPR